MDNIEANWHTSAGDTVEVYVSPVTCLRDDCLVQHREYRYRIRAANNRIVETGSEGYTRRAAAVTAAERHHPRVES